MMNMDEPKIIFGYEFDERAQFEERNRGYLNYAMVLLNNENLYNVYFYTSYRLVQDLEEGMKFGYRFIAEEGMIVIPEITLENMQDAVNKLEKQGFFNHLVPVEQGKTDNPNMNSPESPKLIFDYEFDERAQFEVKCKGWLSYVKVLLSNGNLYPVFFYDPGRLRQDLEGDTNYGDRFIAEEGMIVIPEITLEDMQDAVNKLEKQGFFNHLVPVEQGKTDNPNSPPL